MEQFVSFLAKIDWYVVIQSLLVLCCFVYSIKVNGLSKTVKKLLGDMQNMEFLRPDDRPRTAQMFDNTVKDYVLNSVTNELVESPVLKDVQASIDSYATCSLDSALDKFLPNVVDETDQVAELNTMSADLAAMAEMYERAEDYREKFNLGDDMSVADIYKAVGQKANELAENLKKGDKGNETQENVEQKSK